MVNTTERGLVLQDLALAASNFVLFLLLVDTLPTAGGWWYAAIVAIVAGGLLAAADRSRAGLWALIVAGVAAMGAIVWATVADALPVSGLAWLFLGLALGLAGNRIIFGVVRAVPEFRRRTSIE